MNTSDCDRVRMQLMAAAEGETGQPSGPDERHLSSCAACQRWLQELTAVSAELQTLSYPSQRADLWRGVEERIHPPRRASIAGRLWAVGLLALGWRALQLFADQPAPVLLWLVPLAAAVLVTWWIGRGLLAIETWAPELQERGI